MTRRYHIWTEEEVEFLRENGYLGVKGCTRAFNREFGLLMRRDAVKRQASRKQISLTRHAICSECGRVMPRDTPDGLCLVCHERSLATPASEQRAALMRRMNYTAEDMEAVEEARKRRAVMRQRKHRSNVEDS